MSPEIQSLLLGLVYIYDNASPIPTHLPGAQASEVLSRSCPCDLRPLV